MHHVFIKGGGEGLCDERKFSTLVTCFPPYSGICKTCRLFGRRGNRFAVPRGTAGQFRATLVHKGKQGRQTRCMLWFGGGALASRRLVSLSSAEDKRGGRRTSSQMVSAILSLPGGPVRILVSVSAEILAGTPDFSGSSTAASCQVIKGLRRHPLVRIIRVEQSEVWWV